MNDIQIFKNDSFGAVRTVEVNGTPYFVGKDVAEILGYTNPTKALQDHVDSEDMTFNESLKLSRQSGAWLINESGLYSLILCSKLPKAKQFKHWVTSEILPAIRKHGAYMTEQTLEQALTSPDFLIKLANQLKSEQEKNAKLTETVDKQNGTNSFLFPTILLGSRVKIPRRAFIKAMEGE